MSEVGKIYGAINAIMQEVGYVQKQKGANLNYTYASESALIEALRPVMVKHGVIAFVVGHGELTREEYQSKSGARMINSVLPGVVRFQHIDGSFIDVYAQGEGSDSGDKSVNKAQTGMLKYALRQTFLIETGDDPDKDASDERTGTKTTKTVTKAPATDHSWSAFLAHAGTKGVDEATARAKLKAAGFSGWEPKNWDKAVAAIA